MNEYEVRWPRDADSDSLLSAVGEDVIEAIVHLPKSIWTGRIRVSEWRSSEEYKALLLDHLLLEVKASNEELLAFREEYRDIPDGSEAALRSAIQEPFSHTR